MKHVGKGLEYFRLERMYVCSLLVTLSVLYLEQVFVNRKGSPRRPRSSQTTRPSTTLESSMNKTGTIKNGE